MLGLLSCQDKEKDAQIKQMELEIKAKELELQQKDFDFKERSYQDSLNRLEVDKNENKSLSDLYDENKKSVFFIMVDNDYERATGSGFFIREDGLALSNYHVFKNADRAIIYTDDKEQYMINEIVAYDEEEDYILFKISNTSNQRFKPVSIAKSTPRIGEECFAIGNPRGRVQTLSKGIVSNFTSNRIQTTAQITFGSSGGALFNERGEAIGITTGGIGEADLNFAINLVEMDFIRPYLNPSTNEVLSSTTIGLNERQNVVNVLKRYFDKFHNNDIEGVRNMYANVLSRCYNELNLSRTKVMQEHYNYYKTYPYQKADVDYNSIEMSKDFDGTIYVSFKMDFTISKPSWSKPKTFKNNMFISFDKDLKISSIYNNIIK